MNYCKIINKIKKYYYNAIREKFRKSHNVPCSVCGKPLVEGGLKNYETLNDHVFDPNGESGPAPTLICNNVNCEHNCKSFIKIAWLKRESYSVPIRGIVVCYGGEEK
jgi:hypothetical protein